MLRFEYVFDLSFCALAWRAAEEFEEESDTSGDEGPSDAPTPAVPSVATDAPKKQKTSKRTGKEPANEGKRRVQVTGEATRDFSTFGDERGATGRRWLPPLLPTTAGGPQTVSIPLLFRFFLASGSHNIKRVALPVRGELVLDSHDACNQMSLVNHYGASSRGLICTTSECMRGLPDLTYIYIYICIIYMQ